MPLNILSFLINLATNTSSPTFGTENENMENGQAQGRVVTGNAFRDMMGKMAERHMKDLRNSAESELQANTVSIKQEIDAKFDKSSSEMAKYLQNYYTLGLQGGENLMARLEEPFERIGGGLVALLEKDPYAFEYVRMKYEIIDLKKKLGIRELNILDHLH